MICPQTTVSLKNKMVVFVRFIHRNVPQTVTKTMEKMKPADRFSLPDEVMSRRKKGKSNLPQGVTSELILKISLQIDDSLHSSRVELR